MKLPENITLYFGAHRYSGYVPDDVFAKLDKATQEKIVGKPEQKRQKKNDKSA